MGFLEIESLCLSTGQVKCKQKRSFLLAAVSWPTHCSGGLPLVLLRSDSHSTCRGIGPALGWCSNLCMLPEEDAEEPPRLLGEEGKVECRPGKNEISDALYSSLVKEKCGATEAGANLNCQQHTAPDTGESRPSLWFRKGLTDNWQVIRQPANSLLHCTNIFECLLGPGSTLGTRDSVTNKTKQQQPYKTVHEKGT